MTTNTTTTMQVPLSWHVGCHANDPTVIPAYGYIPTFSTGVIFCVFFGLSTLIHLGQTFWRRHWWTLVFSIGAMVETIGWAGRTWNAQCPYNQTAFLMQISTLIIAPTFFTAGIYIILGRLITTMGPASSPISAKMYLYVFCTCDVLSLVIQAIGGGVASKASNSVDGDTAPGTHTMVAGIVFQLASMTFFFLFFAEFLRRSHFTTLPRKLKLLIAATTLSLVLVYTRGIYRTIELSEGWTGYLISHERYFVALDGAMMVLAVAVFNVLHPSWLLHVRVDKVVGEGEKEGPGTDSDDGRKWEDDVGEC